MFQLYISEQLLNFTGSLAIRSIVHAFILTTLFAFVFLFCFVLFFFFSFFVCLFVVFLTVLRALSQGKHNILKRFPTCRHLKLHRFKYASFFRVGM